MAERKPTLGHLERLVLAALTEAARQGAECPSNLDLANRYFMHAPSSASAAIRTLESKGYISVTRLNTGRIVGICGTEFSTLKIAGALHWRSTARAGSIVAKIASTRLVEKEKRGPHHEPAMKGEIVRRDPCFKCGVRGDIGCQHVSAAS